MIKPADFFDLSNEVAQLLFRDCAYVWQALAQIDRCISELVGKNQIILGTIMPGAHIGDKPIFVDKGAVVEPGAFIQGPAYIGAKAIVRHGAYIRGNVIMLPESLLGHASEAKNSLFLPKALAPHFNYIGDSILGQRVNLGAGTKLSNLAINSEKDPITRKRPTIRIRIGNTDYDTGLEKLGGILGDDVQTGCNAVLNPGCLVGQSTLIYADVSLRKGYYPPRVIIKLRQQIEQVEKT